MKLMTNFINVGSSLLLGALLLMASISFMWLIAYMAIALGAFK